MTATDPPPIPAPPAEAVFVERFPEPITGWEMVGAGASWDATPFPAPLEAEVRYDGVPRVQTPVSADGARHHFGVQLPREPDAKRVTVLLRGAGAEVTLFDGEASGLPERGAGSPAPTGQLPRWLSPAATLGRSIASGEALSAGWWSARLRRYREKAIQARIRVRDKLLIRSRHRSRSPHDAYVDRTTLTPADLRGDDRACGPVPLPADDSAFWFPSTTSIRGGWPSASSRCRRQAYPHWELCLADDASTDPATRAAPRPAAEGRPRIKLVRRPTNGHICAATNSAAELATGEFVALLDNDDALAPHALFAVAELLQSHPDADLIYSDEDKIDAAGPALRPAVQAGLVAGTAAQLQLRQPLHRDPPVGVRAAGRFREGYEGSQDHDLLLRVTELTDRVRHVPRSPLPLAVAAEFDGLHRGREAVRPHLRPEGGRGRPRPAEDRRVPVRPAVRGETRTAGPRPRRPGRRAVGRGDRPGRRRGRGPHGPGGPADDRVPELHGLPRHRRGAAGRRAEPTGRRARRGVPAVPRSRGGADRPAVAVPAGGLREAARRRGGRRPGPRRRRDGSSRPGRCSAWPTARSPATPSPDRSRTR